MNTTPTDFIAHGEVKLMPSVMPSEELCMLPEEKGKHQPGYKQWWPTYIIHWCNSGTEVVTVTNYSLSFLTSHSMRCEKNYICI